MKLARTREYKVNMGNYEHVQVSSLVMVDGIDLFTEEELAEMDPEDVMKALREFCEKHVNDQLEPELADARRMSDAKDSMLFIEPEPPRRTERVSARRSK